MRPSQRWGLYVACGAMVWFYLCYESGQVFFGVFVASIFWINRTMDIFMLGLALATRSAWPVLYVVGGGLNNLVWWANGYKMPVVGGVPVTSQHIAATDSSRLLWLADRFKFWGGEASVGDLLVVLGLVGAFLWSVPRLLDAPQQSAPKGRFEGAP